MARAQLVTALAASACNSSTKCRLPELCRPRGLTGRPCSVGQRDAPTRCAWMETAHSMRCSCTPMNGMICMHAPSHVVAGRHASCHLCYVCDAPYTAHQQATRLVCGKRKNPCFRNNSPLHVSQAGCPHLHDACGQCVWANASHWMCYIMRSPLWAAYM